MAIFNSKGSFYKFYPNLPNTFFNLKISKFKISKMSKIKIRIIEIS